MKGSIASVINLERGAHSVDSTQALLCIYLIMVLLSQESVQMGGAPQVGAALLRVLQHGYTEQ